MNYSLNCIKITAMACKSSKFIFNKFLTILLFLLFLLYCDIYADVANLEASVLAHKDTTKYSVFDINTIVYRSKPEIAELYSATGQDISSLITFTPQRLLLHEVIVQTITRWKSDNDNQIIDKVLLVYKNLMKSAETHKVFNEIFKYRFQLNNSSLESLKTLSTNIKIKNNYIPGKFIKEYDQNKVLSILITDRAYNKYATQKIENLVTNFFDSEFRFNPKSEINSNKSVRPYTLLLSDILTDSSGRQNTYPRFVRLKFEQNGITWANVVKVSSNIFYTMLYLNKKVIVNPLNEAFMLPEKEMLKNKLMTKIQELYHKKIIQHIFWKDLLLEPQLITLGLNNNGVVSIELITGEHFHQFNSKLYKGTKYKFTNKILDDYNAMIVNLPGNFINFSGKNLYFTLFDVAHKNNALTKVVEIFNAQRYVRVNNSEKMLNFLKASRGNNQIKSTPDMLDSMKIKNYLMPFVGQGYTISNYTDKK